MSSYFLSRQRDFKDNNLYVEIAVGGSKKAGIDILTPRYHGETMNLTDPKDAIRLAIDMYKKWEYDYPDEKKQIRIVGLEKNLCFEPTTKGFAMLTTWAEKTFQGMTKCGKCGKPMGNRAGIQTDDINNLVFCTEACLCSKYRDMFGVEYNKPLNKKKNPILIKK